MVFQRELTLRTQSSGEMHDLTDAVARIVSESGVRTGIVQIFNVGSTAAIGAIEFEPGLEQDLPALLRRLVPPSRDYAHEQTWHDGNGHSHLQATLLGPSLIGARTRRPAGARRLATDLSHRMRRAPP
jgi:secondary thiamine-phosphate synthase enzyme